MNDVKKEKLNNNTEQEFFSVSVKKLCIMYVLTLGLYVLVFFYKNWTLQKYKHQLSVLPALRTIFYIFFTHSLFKRVVDKAKESNIEGVSSFGLLATIFVILNIASSFIGIFAPPQETATIYDAANIALLMIALVPLVKVQKTILIINNDPNGSSNSKFTAYNWIFIVLGGLLWLGMVASFFISTQPL